MMRDTVRYLVISIISHLSSFPGRAPPKDGLAIYKQRIFITRCLPLFFFWQGIIDHNYISVLIMLSMEELAFKLIWCKTPLETKHKLSFLMFLIKEKK